MHMWKRGYVDWQQYLFKKNPGIVVDYKVNFVSSIVAANKANVVRLYHHIALLDTFYSALVKSYLRFWVPTYQG